MGQTKFEKSEMLCLIPKLLSISFSSPFDEPEQQKTCN
jgi:hypothetical protein